MVLFDRGNEVTLHDLHVVDVEEQAEICRAELFAEFDAPRALVAHVVGVIHATVEQFHHERDPVLLRQRQHFLQSGHAVLEARLFVHAVPVAGEADDFLEALLRARGEQRLVGFHQQIVIRRVVEAVWYAADFLAARPRDGGKADHRRRQSVLFHLRKVRRVHKVNGSDAHRLRRRAELIERHLVIAPFADGMIDAALETGLFIRGGKAVRERSRDSGHAESGEAAAGE